MIRRIKGYRSFHHRTKRVVANARECTRHVVSYQFSPADVRSLMPGETYLVSAELHRTALAVPNPASAWMSDWGFGFADEQATIKRQPKFFPTLNLRQTSSVIEAALQRSVHAHEDAVVGLPLVVEARE